MEDKNRQAREQKEDEHIQATTPTTPTTTRIIFSSASKAHDISVHGYKCIGLWYAMVKHTESCVLK